MKYEPATYVAEGPRPGTLALNAVVASMFPVGSYGIYSVRKIRGGEALSLHAEGRAWDCKTKDVDLGNKLFNLLIRTEIGIQRIIWNGKEWHIDKSIIEYRGINPHSDHLHIELTKHAADTLTKEQVREGLKEI